MQLARKVPGKDEFDETLRYFENQLSTHKVEIKTGAAASVQMIIDENFEEIIIATGVAPRQIELDGIDHAKTATYPQILSGERTCGDNVAIIGAGGIGFDVADFLSALESDDRTPEAFLNDWGVDQGLEVKGGISPHGPSLEQSARQITLLQRTSGKPGRSLGFTTGWAVIKALKRRGVSILTGVTYERISDEGLHIEMEGKKTIIPADTIVICAGQESRTSLHEELSMAGVSTHIIGGAAKAGELDALRAISQGYNLALSL